MNLRTKIGVVAVLLSTLTVQAQNIPFRKAEIKETMKKVADWQIANPNKGAEHGDLSWTNAVLYVGMLDWAELAEREDGNKDYFKWLTRIGSRNGWQPDKRMYHADDIAVSQLFIDLYRKYKNKYMLNPTIARTDWVMKNPPTDDFKLDYRKPETLERWTWCDALFMAPPVYTKLYVLTGDKKYIKFMNREYKATYDHLFDKEDITVTDCASPGVYITQKNVSRRSADITVKVKLDNGSLAPAQLVLENSIYTQEGKKVVSQRLPLELTPQGTQSYVSTFKLKNPHLWQGREDPYLYKVVSRLLANGEVIDEVTQPLGVRHYEIVAGKGFYLNGEKYPMYGVTRHQDWWGLGSALTNREHDFDLAQIMDVGATTVRFAHYQQSEYLYSRCDTLGLIIWAEIPFVNRVTGYESENAQTQLRELIRQSFNHPSIYVWGLHNEVYQPHEYTASLTQSLHDLAKTEDPDRYTVAVNGYGHANHPVNQNTDIQGMNRYFGWYEKKVQDIKPWVEGLEKDYPWQKLMLTEYGADANLDHQTEYLGDALNWGKPYYPETFQTKTHEYQWSVIAEHPYIIASYLWNMFDFAVPMWSRGGVPARNLKGLMTFDRKIKKDSYYWYKANWSKSPVLYLTQRRNTDRERKQTSVTVYSNIGTPKVYLNGKELTGIRKGYTDVHYIFDQVTLEKGKNKIKAVAVYNGKEYVDEIEWDYQSEKKRDADAHENKNEHAGW